MTAILELTPTLWLNPAHIAYVRDYPRAEPVPLLVVALAITAGGAAYEHGHAPYELRLRGPERQALLEYLWHPGRMQLSREPDHPEAPDAAADEPMPANDVEQMPEPEDDEIAF